MVTEVSGKSLYQFYSFLQANCEELIFPKYDGKDGINPHDVYYQSFAIGVKAKSTNLATLLVLFQALRKEVSQHLLCRQIIVRSKPSVRNEIDRVVLHTRLGFSGPTDLLGQWRIA